MSEGFRRGEGQISTDSHRTEIKKKRAGKEEADTFLLRTCHISGGEQGAGGVKGGETGVLLAKAKLSPTTLGHFPGTFLQFQVQKELAGGVVNLFPM